jgi:kynureninase
LEWRAEFPILETCAYLVSHSLGPMPRRARAAVGRFLDAWDTRGVRAWSEGWWELGRSTGDLLAPILGVAPGTISMHQNVSVAQAIVASCYDFGRRRKVVMSSLDFPSDMYVYEGFRRFGADVVYVGSDDGLRVPIDRFVHAIDEATALVPISAVLFKSAAIVDLAPIVEKAHEVGAHVVLDVYQAAGSLPLDLAALGVEYAVGGSVKWLCGGPGAGYLYVRPDVAASMRPAVTGWAAHAAPFDFEPGAMRYADGAERFQTGTPNIPALASARSGYEIVNEVGVGAIREKSLRLTGRLVAEAVARGFAVNTPLDPRERAGSVIFDLPDSGAVARALVAHGVIVDHRPGAGIRMSPHFFTSEADIDRAFEVLDEILAASPARTAGA